jgi:hypothetical protein
MLNSPADSRLVALHALAEAGASDRLLGQAVRELLSGEQRPLPGWAVAGAAQPAAVPLTEQANSARREQEKPVQQNRAPATGASRQLQEQQPAKSTARRTTKSSSAELVIINFRDKDNHRSSVSLKPSEWSALSAIAPDEETLRVKAKDLAPLAPENVKRSAWVCQQLHLLYEPATK